MQLASPAAGLDGARGWRARRRGILRAWEGSICGRAPDGEIEVRHRLMLPSGGAPAPVLVVQSSHLWWAERAARRGIAACVVHAADGDDDTAPLGGPALRRRAWAMSRALDALEGHDALDLSSVAVAGHSRNGKAALLAAAFDERFGACLLSSAGVLGAIPARLAADRVLGEGLELLTRVFPHWYLPGLRGFAGREDELPSDAHELMACVAPRHLLVSVGERDPVESTWAAQAAADAAADVWARLGVPGRLSLAWRPGGHDLDEAAVDEHLDRLAAVLGAPGGRRARRAERLHATDWDAAVVSHPTGARSLPRRAFAAGSAPGPARPDTAFSPPGTRGVRTATAAGLAVDVFVPRLASGRRPLVGWHGPLCRPTGYVPAYDHGEPPYGVVARAGFAVACHHPAGTADRLREAVSLDRLVEDAAAALGAAAALPEVDGRAPRVAGYGLGAIVAARLMAALPQVAGGVLAMPVADEAEADLAPLAGRPVLVLVAEGQDAVVAQARAAGLEVELAEPWHRLGMATRRRMARWLQRR